MRKLTLAFLGLLLVLIALSSAACSTGGSSKPSAEAQRSQAARQRTDAYAKAVAQVPTPIPTNFPRRQTLANAVIRQALPNHPWYVYVLGQNGNIVNYFVAKSVPVNDCDYLSSTEQIVDTHGSSWQIKAPSLEGIFQSGSGCNTLTFFDLATNSEVQITSMQTFVTDRPLRVKAQPLQLKTVK